MAQLCLATFAEILLTKLRPPVTQIEVYSRLIGWANAEDSKGETLFVDGKLASNLANQRSDPPAAFQAIVADPSSYADTEEAFEAIVDDIADLKEGDLVSQLVDVMEMDPSVSDSTIAQLKRTLDEDGLTPFLARTFRYAATQPNKRRHDKTLEVDEGWLVHRLNNKCPMCRQQQLTVEDNGVQIQLFDRIEFPREPGSDQSRTLLVCNKCARGRKLTPRLSGEPEGWAHLRSVYEGVLAAQRLDDVLETGVPYPELEHVVAKLANDPGEGAATSYPELSFDPEKVERKISPAHYTLRLQVKQLAEMYYFQVRTLFAAEDDSADTAFDKTARKVKSIYDELASASDDPLAVYDKVIEWIAQRAGVSQNSNGALVVAAFFVQNCEVFVALPK